MPDRPRSVHPLGRPASYAGTASHDAARRVIRLRPSHAAQLPVESLVHRRSAPAPRPALRGRVVRRHRAGYLVELDGDVRALTPDLDSALARLADLAADLAGGEPVEVEVYDGVTLYVTTIPTAG